MDTYHKILHRIFEQTGGDEIIDVDLVDLVKKEGYFPSLDEICSHLKSESWVTESRPNIVRITHWGVAEARKTESGGNETRSSSERESKRLLAEAREFVVLVEDFVSGGDADKAVAIHKKFREMESVLKSIDAS